MDRQLAFEQQRMEPHFERNLGERYLNAHFCNALAIVRSRWSRASGTSADGAVRLKQQHRLQTLPLY